MTQPHVVVIDGLNFIHKAASFAAKKPGPLIIRGIMTSLRSTIEKLKPTRVVIVLEGRPYDRLDAFPEYKANRATVVKTDDNKAEFIRLCNVALHMIRQWFPVTVVRHAGFEADDVIHTVVTRGSRAVRFTIVSSDTDFIQDLEISNVALWNPIKNKYVSHPGYHYVTWKALRGDMGDGIPGIPGIGDKRAELLMSNPDGLANLLAKQEAAERFLLNQQLIQLVELSDADLALLESSTPQRNWEALHRELLNYGLIQFTQEPYWTKKFVATFDQLWVSDQQNSVD